MSEVNASINELEISARVTRKLREAGFKTTSQLTNSWLDPWADSLSAREAREVVDALRTGCWRCGETGEASSEMRPPESHLDDEHDDIIFLSISKNLVNKLRRLGLRKISEVKSALSQLEISAHHKKNLQEAICLWESTCQQERALAVEQHKTAAATAPRLEWFPSNPLSAYSNAGELIETLLDEALTHLNENQQNVLKARAFTKDPSNFKTLQAIADSDHFRVSRERIRQIEALGLKKVRKLVLDCEPLKMLAPRPELKEFWQPLLMELRNLEEISIGALSNLISETLQIPDSHQNRVVALLTPLLTLSVTDDLTARAREGARHRPVSYLPNDLLGLPITHLRLGNSTASLIDKNIHTIEDFYLFCHGRRSQLGKKHQVAFDALTSLARDGSNRAADPELQLSYALNLHIHPFAWQGGVAETYTSFIPWFTQVIGIVLTWGKAEEVFRLRTSLPAGQRMTLSDLAFKLAGNTNGGYAGNVERYILDEMTKIFVHKDLSKCPIHIPSEISALMDILTSCFSEAAGNFELFSTIISYRLDIPEVEVSKSSHLFWALLTGNLPNRYWHLRNRSTNDAAAEEIDFAQENRVVKLKGFRTTY